MCNIVSRKIMKFYISEVDILVKADKTPVTAADLASNDIILNYLSKLTPEIFILSEENEDLDIPNRLKQAWIWCIDPLDGTKEFIKKNDEFSVNIALIHNGIAKLGIVILPVFDTIYYAIKGKGAYKVDKNGIERPIDKGSNSSSPVIKAMTSRSHHNLMSEEILNKRFEKIEWIPKGSSLKLTEIAEGRGDIYLKLGTTMEWDIAAPQVILEETGGKVLTYPSMSPLRYNKPNMLNPNFIALRSGIAF
jgi:3'(2'), 5'-bisphosphate nucleotidase